MSKYHEPVLLQETLEALHIQPGAKYIDATVGGGGHTIEILQHGTKVLGIDVDNDALSYTSKRSEDLMLTKGDRATLLLVQGNFKDIDALAREHDFTNVAGILFDLGVSSFQLETGKKGFSFSHAGPLDMRMEQRLQVKAADLVNGLTKKELTDLFTRFGEERNAKKIAQEITRERENRPIETTDQLVIVIKKAYGVTNEVISQKRQAEMCMRVFQSLRIAVNDELGVIEEALPKALGLLGEAGRLVVISFHSLEDRIVKNTFTELEEKGLGKVITKKPVIARNEEVIQNRRSRSAKLRVFEKKIV